MDACSATLNHHYVWMFPPSQVELEVQSTEVIRSPDCVNFLALRQIADPVLSDAPCYTHGRWAASTPSIDADGCNYQRYIDSLRRPLLDREFSPAGAGFDHAEGGKVLVDALLSIAARAREPENDDTGTMESISHWMEEYRAAVDRVFDDPENFRSGDPHLRHLHLTTAFETANQISRDCAEPLAMAIDLVGRRPVAVFRGQKDVMALGMSSVSPSVRGLCSAPYWCQSILLFSHLENSEVRRNDGSIHDSRRDPMVVAARTTLNSMGHLESALTVSRDTACSRRGGLDALIMAVPYHYYEALTADRPIFLNPKCLVETRRLASVLANASSVRDFFSLARWSREALLKYEDALSPKCSRGAGFAEIQRMVGDELADNAIESTQRLWQGMVAQALIRLEVFKPASGPAGAACTDSPNYRRYGQVQSFHAQYSNPLCDAEHPEDIAERIASAVSALLHHAVPIHDSGWHLGRPATRQTAVRFIVGSALEHLAVGS